MKTSKILILIASVLWFIWGVFHIIGGASLLVALSSESESIPKVIKMNMMGEQTNFHLLQTLKEHSYNNIWLGLVVALGAIWGFKQNNYALFLCSILGGFAQVGFTIFMVIPNFAPMMGTLFSYLVTIALVSGIAGVWLKKKENT